MNNDFQNNENMVIAPDNGETKEEITQAPVIAETDPVSETCEVVSETEKISTETDEVTEVCESTAAEVTSDENAPSVNEKVNISPEAPASAPIPPVHQPVPPTPPTSPAGNYNYNVPPAAPYTVPQQTPASAPATPPAPPMPPTPAKKRGSTAIFVCLWVLIGLFAAGFFGLCGYIIGTNSNNKITTSATEKVPTLYRDKNFRDETPKKTEPEATKPAPEEEEATESNNHSIPLPEDEDFYSDDTSITLNGIPKDYKDANKYTTQYAYETVVESTIGIVCYEGGFSDDPDSQGTGIVISKDGYIATNSHVIGDSRTRYYVQAITNDGIVYDAKVIGYDSRTDLAVLKINANNLTPATFCDSEYVEVGQDVIAVGNPGGLEFQNSLTKGIVSALNRELALSSQVTYIQTDAAINPGNSGGPLCNMYGQVIGINTAKISSSSYEGMGFAIPSSIVKSIVDDLISQGYVENRVRLGISGTAVTSSMQQYYSIPKGILIGDISEGGPCDGKGIEQNDVITAIDSKEISSFSDVYAILAEHKPGDKLVLTVYKTKQNKTVQITVTLMADQGETQE